MSLCEAYKCLTITLLCLPETNKKQQKKNKC